MSGMRMPSLAAALTVVLFALAACSFTASGGGPPNKPAPGQPKSTSAQTGVGQGGCDYVPVDPRNRAELTDVGIPNAPGTDTEPVVFNITSSRGEIEMTLDPILAPCATNSMAFLAEQGFFDGSPCHRLVNGQAFGILQCGDPSGTGSGGPAYSYTFEPASVAGLDAAPDGTSAIYPRGSVAMASGGRPPTIGGQFFICFQDTQLAPDYTLVGTVTAGLEVIEAVAAGGNDGFLETNDDGSRGPGGGAPLLPITLEQVRVQD